MLTLIKWGNITIDDYLEAIARYVKTFKVTMTIQDKDVNADDPDWKTFSDIMKGAAIYEQGKILTWTISVGHFFLH